MVGQHDIVIVGAGIAGLRAAVECSADTDVAVVSKVYPTQSLSGAARGGLAAAIGNEEEDRWEWHCFDTVKAGDYLGDQDAIEIMAREAPRAVYQLEHMGVAFSRTPEGRIAQRNFGGHTRDYGKKPVKRSCYAGESTGRVILNTLYDRCFRDQVKFYTEHHLLSLVFEGKRCVGVVTCDLATGQLHLLQAKAVLLATGGCGSIYQPTSTGFSSTGDGISLAFQSGLPLEDMEFVQFHPTGLSPLGFVVSEVARVEGGILRNRLGERFIERYAPGKKELAAGDVLSRAILTEIRKGKGIRGMDYVHLDLTHLGEETIEEKLREIAIASRLYLGVDPVYDPIPVRPTCHYLLGGIPVNLEGRVQGDEKGGIVGGLFAAGECACLSVHGANRLGTNSLPELLVFGRRSGIAMKKGLSQLEHVPLSGEPLEKAGEGIERLLNRKGGETAGSLQRRMQAIMAECGSAFRNEEGLKKGVDAIQALKGAYQELGVSNKGKVYNYELMEAVGLWGQLALSEAILVSALQRRESRGAHFRTDFRARADRYFMKHTFVFLTAKGLEVRYKPVKITRFQPEARVY